MTSSADSSDSRLDQVLADYLRRIESGESPDEQAFLAAHSDLADELRSFFRNRAAMARLAQPLQAAAAETPTIALDGATGEDSANRLRYVGDYELLEEIARGGMGVVYRARQVSLNRAVAVKMILSGQLASSEEVQRFRHEAEAAAALDHPAIVPIYEVGEHEGRHYFSMGLVEGRSLAARLAAGPMEPEEAASLVAEIARAVEYAHERGVIHRDLKPSNILLDRAGKPRVTDFGLARHDARDESLTATGQVLGTPGYMPPEQAASKSESIGPASDVYSLGAILYAAVTGRPPFQAATPVDTILQVLSAEPVSPRQLNPSVPEDLDTVILKCLEKRPEYRYPSAAALADDLDRFVAGEPIAARPPGLIERASRWLARQRQGVVIALITAAASVLLIVGGVAGNTAYLQSRQGKLQLQTDQPWIVGQVFAADDASHRAAPLTDPVTIPTQVPLSLPADGYRLRATGREEWSADFLVAVERGTETSAKLKLDNHRLWPEQAVSNWCQVIRDRGPGKPATVVSFDDEGIKRFLPDSKQPNALNLLNHAKLAGLGAPWYSKSYLRPDDGQGKVNSRPALMATFPLLDDDQAGDLVLYLRQRPAIVAISSDKNEILWVYVPAGYDEALQGRTEFAVREGMHSGTVAGSPLAVSDLDGDGVSDLVAAFVVAHPIDIDASLIKRSIDAISGKTGKQIWSYALPEEWFEIPAGQWPPQGIGWRFSAGFGIGGASRMDYPYGNTHRNSFAQFLTGYDDLLPYSPQLCRDGSRHGVAIVAGRRVVALDLKTGQPWNAPVDLGFISISAPRFADLDGDGSDEVVLVEAKGTINRDGQLSKQSLWAWSLGRREQLWKPREQVADFEKHLGKFQKLPQWPVVADLNADGKADGNANRNMVLLAPNGTSTFENAAPLESHRAWGGLEAIDGATGKLLWSRQLDTADTQVDQFLVGPDLDGDGWREIYTANLFARGVHRPVYVYVDALSGKDGHSLWTARRSITTRHPQLHYEVIDQIAWNEAGADGWPQLCVPILEVSDGEPLHVFHFSAGTGELTSEANGLPAPQLMDGDGDGLQDRFVSLDNDPQRVFEGSRLLSFQSSSPIRWRRLGGQWRAAADYDGDGFPDVINRGSLAGFGGPRVAALSGRTGRQIWRSTDTASMPADFLVPLQLDLNGDTLPDILGHNGPRGGGLNPLWAAYSGATGNLLWQSELEVVVNQQTSLLEARDLDGDGRAEVIGIAAFSDLNNGNLINVTVELVVVEGATGATRWRHALSEYDNHQLHSHVARLATVDVNGDRVLDVVAAAWIGGKRELHALDGRSGALLWNVPLPETSDDERHKIELLPWPLAADLDGDRHDEILLLDFPHDKGPGLIQRTAHLLVLRPQDGAALPGWPWKSAGGHMVSGVVDGALHPELDRPLPQIVARGEKTRGVCVWMPNTWEKGLVVMIDESGRDAWRREVDQNYGNVVGPQFRDANGDGFDDVAVMFGAELHLLDGRDGRDLRTQSFNASRATLVDYAPDGNDVKGPLVILADRRLLAIDPRDGKALWACNGLAREFTNRRQSMPELLLPRDAQLPPAILWTAGEGDTQLQQAWPVAGSTYDKSEIIASLRSPARIEPDAADPRFERPLPWTPTAASYWHTPYFLFSGLLFAPLLIGVPSWFFYNLARRRRWSLAGFLMAPAAVLLFLVGLTLPTPEGLSSGYFESRWWIGAAMLPAIFYAVWMCQAFVTGEWQKWLGFLAFFPLGMALIAAQGLIVDSFTRDPREFYVAAGWWWILVLGFYVGSWIAFVLGAGRWAIGEGQRLYRLARCRWWPTSGVAPENSGSAS